MQYETVDVLYISGETWLVFESDVATKYVRKSHLVSFVEHTGSSLRNTVHFAGGKFDTIVSAAEFTTALEKNTL